jgi:ATP-dependent DNA ligase
MLERPAKKDVGLFEYSACRRHTCCPLSALYGKFGTSVLNGQLQTKYITRRGGERAKVKFGSARRAIKKRLRCAAIAPNYGHMLQRTLPAGFIAPCLPTKTDRLPSGGLWLHEIKHDGFRIIARKNGAQVRLYSRPDNDFTHRFPLIVESI